MSHECDVRKGEAKTSDLGSVGTATFEERTLRTQKVKLELRAHEPALFVGMQFLKPTYG